jgi:hypothetical protein
LCLYIYILHGLLSVLAKIIQIENNLKINQICKRRA